MVKISQKKNQSYCKCRTVQASDDSTMAPAGRRKDTDQPRYRKPRAMNSSETGAATQKATTNSHRAPSPCADFSTSPMKPGVISRPSARDSKSQPATRTNRVATPSATLLKLVQ